jgi:hypothetical protein
MTLALPASASSSSPSAIVCASEAARRRPDRPAQPIDVWCLRRSSAAGGADAFFAAHADRFRIGVGRRDPGPALERFAAFLEDRA